MSGIALSGARIFDGESWHEGAALLMAGGDIVALCPADEIPPDFDPVALDGGILAPGFVDLQVNGGGGVLFNEARTLDGLRTLCAAHFPFGTTALLPTLITDTFAVTSEALDAGIEAARAELPGFAGLHIEGPHLSLARKGAHNPAFIRPMEERDLDLLVAARKDLPTLLTTVAMESVTPAQIERLAAAGVIVSLGHSDTDFAGAKRGFDAGASMATHLFNAMSQLTNREPGLVGGALETGVWAGLIADGIHVDAATIAIALRGQARPGRIFLVTDAMAPLGTDLDRFTLNGREILRADGALRLADGTLAGADLTMIDAVRFIHFDLGLPVDEALRMASLYPAQAIGRSDRMGRLAPGAKASLVHLSDDLYVRGTWIGGEKVFG